MGAAGDMLTAALLELMPDRAAAIADLNAIGIPQRQLAGNDCKHDVLVLRHQAVHAVDARHGERCARPVKKRALGREDAERKGLHHASPLSIFFALASASSSVPTL